MKVAVIGAGMAGLGAARTLKASGHSVEVFERHHTVGGRASTRTIDSFIFDTGATTLGGRGSNLVSVVLNELPTEDLVVVDQPVYVHSTGRISSGNPARAMRRYVYKQGISKLGELLAAGLTVHTSQKVEAIHKSGAGYRLEGEGLAAAEWDAVIITLPFPSAVELAATCRPRPFPARANHRPCISVCLGYDFEFTAPYFATIDAEQRMPLTWLSIESVKSPGRAPVGGTALMAQMSATYSRYSMSHTDEQTVAETLIDVVRLLDKRFAVPQVSSVKRWKFSQPEVTVSFESVNPVGSTLVIAGDGVSQGRLEHAYDSGITAARFLTESGS